MENKKFLFVCNFKMNSLDVLEYVNAVKDEHIQNLVLCPNFCDIKDYSILKRNGVMLGAQNVSEYEGGAYTGEVCADMLKSAGADFCIVCHSERKRYNYETLSQTKAKAKQLLKCGITPIICVGEDIYKGEEFASKFVLMELNEILDDDIDISQIIVAYEPIWAIGTGKIPTAEHIEKVISSIKKYTGAGVILYGGSFGESNYKEISSISCVDGALIGGASLKPKAIYEMIKKLS